MRVVTYELLENGAAIRCVVCLHVSYNPGAIVDLVCPQCGAKHLELAVRIERAMRQNWKTEQAQRAVRRLTARR